MATKVVPFSRKDYAKRRAKHTSEEREMRRALFAVFHYKVPWWRIRAYVQYSNWGNPQGQTRQNPIVIE